MIVDNKKISIIFINFIIYPFKFIVTVWATELQGAVLILPNRCALASNYGANSTTIISSRRAN